MRIALVIHLSEELQVKRRERKIFETGDEYDCRNPGSNCRRRALLRADHDVGVEPWKRELRS